MHTGESTGWFSAANTRTMNLCGWVIVCARKGSDQSSFPARYCMQKAGVCVYVCKCARASVHTTKTTATMMMMKWMNDGEGKNRSKPSGFFRGVCATSDTIGVCEGRVIATRMMRSKTDRHTCTLKDGSVRNLPRLQSMLLTQMTPPQVQRAKKTKREKSEIACCVRCMM